MASLWRKRQAAHKKLSNTIPCIVLAVLLLAAVFFYNLWDSSHWAMKNVGNLWDSSGRSTKQENSLYGSRNLWDSGGGSRDLWDSSDGSTTNAGFLGGSGNLWDSSHGSMGNMGIQENSWGSVDVCDFSRGKWVYDPLRRASYNESCSDIFKGWNCIKNQRENAGSYLHWRWQPYNCDLPQLGSRIFLRQLTGKRIGFVGDSLNRNMYSSLVCKLKQAGSREIKKWRPIGSDKGITFLEYNVTVAYHRTNLLARYGEWNGTNEDGALDKLGLKAGYRVDVDIPQNTWNQAPQFYDILVLNTGHWWVAPEKFNPISSPMVFFKDGKPLLPPKSPLEGLEITLNHMLNYIENNMKKGGRIFLRTQSPRHFEGGDWKNGGTCHRSKPLASKEVESMFKSGVNSEARVLNAYLVKAAASRNLRLLNITHMSEFRSDGHPSTSAKKVHEDCMHWCLPGVTDSWNDILAQYVLHDEIKGTVTS